MDVGSFYVWCFIRDFTTQAQKKGRVFKIYSNKKNRAKHKI